MSTFEVLMLIAAWCGTPVPYKLDTVQVNACRAKAIQCIISDPIAKTGQYDRVRVTSCIYDTKIGG